VIFEGSFGLVGLGFKVVFCQQVKVHLWISVMLIRFDLTAVLVQVCSTGCVFWHSCSACIWGGPV
jgi:hypothetical protein